MASSARRGTTILHVRNEYLQHEDLDFFGDIIRTLVVGWGPKRGRPRYGSSERGKRTEPGLGAPFWDK